MTNLIVLILKGHLEMEHIEGLYSLAQNNTLLIFFIAILATLLESFIPALPLVAIVIMNSALLGFFKGIIASSIGSCLGTILLFLLASKFRQLKYFKKLENEKTEKVTNWIKKQNYIALYLCYSSIFVPSCLISIASGFSGKPLKYFIPGMVLGKVALFSIASYIGNDIIGFISNLAKIIFVIVMILASFFIGKKISSIITV